MEENMGEECQQQHHWLLRKHQWGHQGRAESLVKKSSREVF